MTGKLTIGYTPPDHDSGYQPILDGSRPGAAQQTVERDAEDLPRRWPGGRVACLTHVTTSARWAEALYPATNAPLEVLEADPRLAVRLIWAAIQSRTPPATQAAMRPVSVGDTITLAFHALARAHAGWVEIPDPGQRNREDPG
jgi:hypothetical protein